MDCLFDGGPQEVVSIDALYKKVVDGCLSPFNKARFMSLAGSHPQVLRLRKGVGKIFNIVSTNSYGVCFDHMFDSRSNYQQATKEDDVLRYSSHLFIRQVAQLINNAYFSVSFVTNSRELITPVIPTPTGHLMREDVSTL
jgi:hypothetical protein